MIKPTLEYEQNLWDKGVEYVVGIDEVGRGSWVGPAVIAGVVFDKNKATNLIADKLKDVRDSKMVTEKNRNRLDLIIKEASLTYCILETPLELINELGVGEGIQKTFASLFGKLSESIAKQTTVHEVEHRIKSSKKSNTLHVLIDAFYIKGVPKGSQTPIVKGDSKCFSISCASIIAKVYRDNLLNDLHTLYPQYALAKNKGYGTKEHQTAINIYGLSQIHRTSFKISANNVTS